MSALKDLTGQRFGRLIVLEYVGAKKHKRLWRCRCDCGGMKIVATAALNNGNVRSCGCLNKEVTIKRSTKHGKTGTPLYGTWKSMKSRCYNPNMNCYGRYGARGITVCDDWKNNFENFYQWSIEHGYREGLKIDRINNNEGYNPDNCRWVTHLENCNNRSTCHIIWYNGKGKTISEWARDFNVSRSVFSSRLKGVSYSIEKYLEKWPLD